MKKRSFDHHLKIIAALLLVCAMFLESVPMMQMHASSAAEEDSSESIVEENSPGDNVFIQMNGENIDSLSMAASDKVLLAAHTSIEGDMTYGWEILVDKENNRWVPIYGFNDISINVTYGMLASFLDENSLAQIRATVKCGNDVYLSDRLLIEVKQPEIDWEGSQHILGLAIPYSITEEYAEVDSSNTVTLTINYLRNTGEQICDPYVATITKGSSFNATVLSPQVIGYEPRFSENKDDLAEEYTFAITSANQNEEINIYYFPIEVKYEVRYYIQGIYNDNYTLKGDPEVAYGVVGSQPDPDLMYASFPGFVKVNHYPEVIAADGNTVFQCFYDRKYCLVDLNLNGGYGVDSVYAKYGTAFIVNTPQKPGYLFVGWDADGDGVEDDMIGTIPAENVSYTAIWTTAETSYTTVYWLTNSDGTSSYLGSRITSSYSAKYVSGSDDLASALVCGNNEHTHIASCYVCGTDAHTHHQHAIDACYSYITANSSAEGNASDMGAMEAANDNDSAHDDGEVYIYVIYTTSNPAYWPKMYINGEYRTITVNGSSTVSSDVLASITDGDEISRGTYGSYTAIKYKAKSTCEYDQCAGAGVCTITEHTHDTDCYSCDTISHSHTPDCYADITHYKFDHADTNVLVAGDGSTVVNVYYKPKLYTLRYYYARSQGSGDDIVYSVVGGSTYPFGTSESDTDENTTLQTLLENVTAWGEVQELPTVNDLYKDRYGYGSATYGDYTYYYLEFTAAYGTVLETLWPIGIFNSVKIVGTHSQCSYDEAYFSAWNGEYRVKYTQDNSYRNYGGNETIKGLYMYLDDNVIFDSQFADVEHTLADGTTKTSLVNFLGFWDNGAEVGWSVPELYRYNLMVESLDGSTGTLYNGKYYQTYKSFDTYDDSNVASQTPTNINGMNYIGYDSTTINDGSDGNMEQYSINFYYDRELYDLTFHNYGSDEKKVLDIPYGKSISDQSFTPSYPSSLEQGAYRFAGWYTTAGCYDGTQFTFDTMPANDLILYAKWQLITHDVTFYNTYQDMQDGNALKTVTVEHGDVLESDDVPSTSNTGYTAGEWFYIKNGSKVAYQPLSILVKQDLEVYREWTSSTVVEFTVHYYLEGTTTPVADSTRGWVFDGQTKTFQAKGGGELGELYDDYAAGYYPKLSSTSIIADKDSENTVVFEYVYKESNRYTVKYVDADGVEIMQSKVVGDNKQSVVTEIYEPIDGYIPDAYYKQLVLALNEDDDPNVNVITFTYTKATNSAYYAIEYYFMDPNGSTYTLGAKIQSPIEIGTCATVPDMVTTGFDWHQTGDAMPPCRVMHGDSDEWEDLTKENKDTITIESSGALIQVYYKRLTTAYTVQYLIASPSENQNPVLKPSTSGTDYFGANVTVSAGDDVEGFLLISDATQTKELMYDDPDDANDSENIFTFYYEEKLKTIEYKVVVRDQRFAEDINMNVGFVSHTKDVKKYTQDYDSNTATARPGFYFVGWYSDAALTNQVSTNGTLTPTGNDDTTYYALFEPYYTNITINKSVDVVNNNQTFLFRVVGNDVTNDHVDITVSIDGNGSVDVCHLPLGSYTITDITTWTWEYNVVGDSAKTIEAVQDAAQNTVSFGGQLGDSAWLNGDACETNVFN